MKQENQKPIQQRKNMTAKQTKILHAAVSLFAKKGYFNTSTSEIAKMADVAEGTIFRHYPTKKDLLEAVLAPAVVDFTAGYFADRFITDAIHISHDNMHSFLEGFIRNRFSFAKENAPAVKILLQELAFQPEMQTTIKHVFQTRVYPQLAKVLTYFKEQGELKDIAVSDMIRMMIPAVLGLIINRFIIPSEQEHDDEKEIKQTIVFIMSGLGA